MKYLKQIFVIAFIFSVTWLVADYTNYSSIRIEPSANDTQALRVDNTSGTAQFTVSTAGAVTFAGAQTFNGSVTIGDAVTDGLTITAAIQGASPLIFDGATDNTNEITLAVNDPGSDITMNLNATAAGSLMVSSLTTNDVDVANSVWGVSNGIAFEGATADAFELTLAPADVGADRTVTIPDGGAATSVMLSTLTTNAPDAANSITGISNGLVFEGATADAFETTVSPVDATADQTISIPNNAVASALMVSTLTTNAVGASNGVWGVSNGVTFEGTTGDASEITVDAGEPTADATWTIPNFAVNAAFVGSTLTTNNVDAANSVWATSNNIVFEGSAADASELSITPTNPNSDQTITIPDRTGQLLLATTASVITAGATPTLTTGLSNVYTDTIVTDNQDQTITFSGGGVSGDEITIIFITDAAGANDEVITFQTTLTNTTGTLTLANLASNRYTIRFISDGTVWNEVSRTGAQT